MKAFRISKEAVLITALICWELLTGNGVLIPSSIQHNWDDTLLCSSRYCRKLQLMWGMLTYNFLDVVF